MKVFKNAIRLVRSDAPSELRKGSTLDRVITLAGDMANEKRPGFPQVVELAAACLKAACKHYKRSFSDPVLCRSGEENGKPYCGEKCTRCIAGQFIPGEPNCHGFVGDIVGGVEKIA